MKETEKKRPTSKLSSYIKALVLLWRARSHVEAVDQLTMHLKDTGASEQFIPTVKELALALTEMHRDDESFHRINRYLVGGMGGIDLLLLSVILPMGIPDPPSFIALLALVVSLPLVSTFLFISFLKEGNGITTYGRIHSTLSAFSMYTGITATTALIWHISRLDGIVFLCLTTLLYISCSFYVAIIALGKHLKRKYADQVIGIAVAQPAAVTESRTDISTSHNLNS